MGAVNINNTGSGSSVVLSSDGTSLLLNGTAIGGGGGSSTLVFNNQTAAYTVVSGDAGKIINCTANTFTVAITAAATLGSGFNFVVWNTGTGNITIDPNASETIDGKTTFVLRQNQGTQIICNGTNFNTGSPKQYFLYSEKYDPSLGGRPITTATQGSIAMGYDATASGNLSFANGFVATASGENALAIGYRTTASSANSTSLGQNSAYQGSQAVTGAGAMALGGSYASGTDSFAAASTNNTSTYGAKGANSIALGKNSVASATNTFAIGTSTSASGGDGAFSAGSATSASLGSFATGYLCNATGSYSQAIGFGATSNGIYGKFAKQNGYFSNYGDAQFGITILRGATTDATAKVLTSNGSSASATNQVILSTTCAYAFTGTVVARQSSTNGTASAAWQVSGLIRQEATAGTTTLVASTVTAISNVPSWTLALSADTTNGGLAVTATGAAATNIQWVATIQTVETIYA